MTERKSINSPGFKKTKSFTDAKIAFEKEERLLKNQSQLSKQNNLLLNLAGVRLGKPKPKQTPQFKPNVNMVTKKHEDKLYQTKQQQKQTEKHTLPCRKGRQLLNELGKQDNISSQLESNLIINDDMLLEPVRKFERVSPAISSGGAVDTEFESDSSEDNNEENTSIEYNDNSNDKIKGNYSGYIYKILNTKKLKKMWFSLIFKDLYFYKSKDEAIHKGMHNLSGVFLREEPETDIEGKHFYVFSIVSEDKAKKYYVKDKEG